MEKLEDSGIVFLYSNRKKHKKFEKGPATIHKPVGIDTSKDIYYYL